MKKIKIISAVSIIGLVLLSLASCEDTTDTFQISTPTAPILADLNFSSIELDAVNTSNPALTLNWVESDYGQQTAVNYAIQFASDEGFTNPVTAASITGQSALTLSVSEINAAAGNAGLDPFVWSTIYTRIVASLGSQNSESINSNTLQFEVYPYFNYVFEDYYLVGGGTAAGWDNNANNPPLFRDESNPNLYYYTGYFAKPGGFDEGRFKVIESRGLWQPQWGVTDDEGSDTPQTAGDIAGNPETQASDPGRFGVPQTGFFSFTIDFSTKKYTLIPFDASGITSPVTLSIEGSSVATTALTPLAFDGHIWYASALRLTPGEITFLADSNTWGSTTAFSGVATINGGSIPVIVEDDYDVWFNDLTGHYILIPLNL